MSVVKKFNINNSREIKVTSNYPNVTYVTDGLMSTDDKIALDALVAANVSGGDIQNITITGPDLTEVKNTLTEMKDDVEANYLSITEVKNTLTEIKDDVDSNHLSITTLENNAPKHYANTPTAEEFVDIRVGDFISDCIVVYKSTTTIVTISGGTTNTSNYIAKILYTLYDGVVMKTTAGTAGTYPMIMTAINIPQPIPNVSNISELSFGSKVQYINTTSEKTVISAAINGKAVQVLDGPKMTRYVLEGETGSETIKSEDYNFHRNWDSSITADVFTKVNPGDHIGDNIVLRASANLVTAVDIENLKVNKFSKKSDGTVTINQTPIISDNTYQQKSKNFTSVTVDNFSEIKLGDTVGGNIVISKTTNNITLDNGSANIYYDLSGNTVTQSTGWHRCDLIELDDQNRLKSMPVMFPHGLVSSSNGDCGHVVSYESGKGTYTFTGRTLSLYEDVNNTPVKLVEEYNIPKIWKNVTVNNFTEIKNNDRINEEIVFFSGKYNDGQLHIFTLGCYNNVNYIYSIVNNKIQKDSISLMMDYHSWYGQDMNDTEFYKINKDYYIKYDNGMDDYYLPVIYTECQNALYDNGSEIFRAFGYGTLLECERTGPETFKKQEYYMTKIWENMSSTEMYNLNFNAVHVGDYFMNGLVLYKEGVGKPSYTLSSGKIIIASSSSILKYEWSNGTLKYSEMSYTFTNEVTIPAPSE